jgi:hypothetical protein
MNRNSNYRLRLRAQADAAKATSLAHIVELRRIEEESRLAGALRESGRGAQMQDTLAGFLLAQSTPPSLVKGQQSHE